MRHYKKGRKLGTDASHTAAIKKNLMVNLFENDRIKTTLERAKEVRGDVDRIITWAKRGDVHSRRLAIAKLGDKDLVAEIFAKVEQGLYKDRPGGYTRIFKMGKRRGDDAVIVLMELVQEPVRFKKKVAAEEEEKTGGLRISRRGRKKEEAGAVVASDLETDEELEPEESLEDEELESEESLEDEAADDEVSADEAADDETSDDEAAAEAGDEAADEAADDDAAAEASEDTADSDDVIVIEADLIPGADEASEPEADEAGEPEADESSEPEAEKTEEEVALKSDESDK